MKVTLLKDVEIINRCDLRKLPEAKEQQPPPVGYCMGSNFYQYKDTNLFQWYANTSAGNWTPYGKMLVIDEQTG